MYDRHKLGVEKVLVEKVLMEKGQTSEIVMQGMELVLLGMGTVFAFLTALVLLTMLMSLLLRVAGNEPAAAMDSDIDPTTLAVISAAIARYKSRQRS